MFTPGDKLEFGHYTILKSLGSGGMGVVYQCRDEYLQRDIAIKMLLPELMSDDETVEHFRREARLAAQLEHPHIVTIYSIGMENRHGKVHHYIAMEYLPGGSLKGRIGSTPIPLEQVVDWMHQLAVAVNYAHKRGVVHQDIKPDNIFITNDKNVKIGDFGLARIATGVALERAAAGTPAYMSPELCRGEPRDHRSDIYSLGAVFFEMLTGVRPFAATSLVEMAMKHATAPVPSARELRSDVPIVLDKAVKYMMAKSPDSRLQSLQDLLPSVEKLLVELKGARLGVTNPKTARPVEPERKEPEPAKQVPEPEKQVPEPAKQVPEPEKQVPEPEKQVPEPAKQVPESEKQIPEPEKQVREAEKQLQEQEKQTQELERQTLELEKQTLEPEKPKVEPPAEQVPAAPGKVPAGADAKTRVKATSEFDLTDLFATTGKNGGDYEPPAQEVEPAVEPAVVSAANPAEMSEIDAIMTEMTTAAGGSAPLTSREVIEKKVEEAAARQAQEATFDFAPAEKRKGTDSSPSERMPEPPSSMAVTIELKKPGVDLSLERELHIQWRYKSFGPIGWHAAPVLNRSKKLLYVPSADSILHALDWATGELKWHYQTAGPLVTSPLLVGDHLYCPSSDGTLYCLAPTDGRLLWKFESCAALVATPAQTPEGIVLTAGDGSLRCLAAEDGKVLWTYRAENEIVSAPETSDGVTFFASKDAHLYAVAGNGQLKWKIGLDSPVVSGCLASSDSVFCATTGGTIYALNVEAGDEVWTHKSSEIFWSRGVLDFTTLSYASPDGQILSLDRYHGQVKWQTSAAGPIIGGLVGQGTSLYAASKNGFLQCMTAKNGEVNWYLNFNTPLHSLPLVTSQTIYLGAMSGEMFAVTPPAKPH